MLSEWVEFGKGSVESVEMRATAVHHHSHAICVHTHSLTHMVYVFQLKNTFHSHCRSFIYSNDNVATGKAGLGNSAEEDENEPRDEMELAHTLILNEDALKQLPEHKRAVFELEWLRYLEKSLPSMPKHEIKTGQKKLVQQLSERIQGAPGPPMRKLIASALATLFSVGDTFMLFDTVNACNDILKNKDDSPSYLPTKL